MFKLKAVSRRAFVRDSLGGAAAAASLGLARPLWGAEPRLRFPTAPRERLAVTSWPFRAYIESPTNRARDPRLPGMDVKDFAAMVVKKFGVRNINPLADHFRSTDPAYLEAFRRAVEQAGSHMAGLGLGGRSFYDPDASERAAAVAYGKKWIDIAVIVGSPSIRQHVRGAHGQAPDVDRAARSLGELAEYGAKKNIVVNLENDSPVAENPFFLVKVIERAQNPYLRALPDFGNSIVIGGAELNERALTQMFQHAFNMSHVKDAVTDPHGKVYTVDLGRIFGIAKASAYRGYFSMEWDTAEGDVYQGTQRLIDESLKYLT